MTRQMVVAAHSGEATPPDSGDGGGSTWGVLRLQEDDGKLCEEVLILLPALIAASGVGKWRATAAARVRRVSSFAGKNPHHGVCYL
jgi:hypothetical protein